MSGIAGQLVIILWTVAAVCLGRLVASRIAGVRGLRASLTTAAESGRPKIAFARAFAAIVTLYVFSAVLFVVALGCGGITEFDEKSMRVAVAADGPAAKAGMIDGDRIVSFDGEPITSWDQLKRLVAAHKSERIVLEIDRDGAMQKMPVDVGPDAKIRVAPPPVHRAVPFGEAVARGFVGPAQVAGIVVANLVRIFRGRPDVAELYGPSEIHGEIQQAGEAGAAAWLALVAVVASYQAVFVDLVLLVLAAITSLSRKMVPSAGNSS